MSRNPAALQQPLESRIKGSVIDYELVIRLSFEKAGNPVCVVRAELQTSQNEDLECPLEQIESLR